MYFKYFTRHCFLTVVLQWVIQGSKWVSSEKSEKCTMLSVTSSSATMHRNLAGFILLQGDLGVLPQNIFDIRGFNQGVHSGAIVGCFNQIPLPPPLQKNSLQIYTDLENGLDTWKIV